MFAYPCNTTESEKIVRHHFGAGQNHRAAAHCFVIASLTCPARQSIRILSRTVKHLRTVHVQLFPSVRDAGQRVAAGIRPPCPTACIHAFRQISAGTEPTREEPNCGEEHSALQSFHQCCTYPIPCCIMSPSALLRTPLCRGKQIYHHPHQKSEQVP